MARVLLLLPTSTYRAPDFLAAARALDVEVVVGSEAPQTLAASMGDRALEVPLCDPDAAVDAIVAHHTRRGLDAVVAVDDAGVVVAARAAARLGLPHNPPAAAAATRDKVVMRRLLTAAGLPQPRVGEDVGFPCVVKPAGLSASRGVIRADDPGRLRAARARVDRIAGGPVLVEEYVPGVEVAVEGLLHGGELEILAVFDKPDPLEGPYFEETIYVTPSRLPPEAQRDVAHATARATTALGLVEGPIHAEARIHDARVVILEVAARSIGGLCARALRFGAGISLEELVLRHALGLPLDELSRERAASGVMMLPIPRAGTLEEVRGQEEARSVPGIVGLEITVARGRPLVPLPEGDRYLGFLFARGESPADVERSLRAGFACLEIVVT